MIARLAKVLGRVRASISRLTRVGRVPSGDVVRVRVHVEYDDLGQAYIARCVDLPGCISYGSTEQEAVENVIEAFTGVMNVRLQSRAREAVRDTAEKPSDHYSHDLALTV